MNIFITGASSGFGLAVVDSLLSRGHKVVTSFRGGVNRFNHIYREQLSRYPGRVFYLELDLGIPLEQYKLTSVIKDVFGSHLDILINNAGFGYYGPLELIHADELRAQLEVCFFSPVLIIQNLLPFLRNTRGTIINISSVAGISAFPFYGAYNSCKFALDGVSEAMWYELKAMGITLNVVNPGAFNSGFSNKSVLFGTNIENQKHYQPSLSKFKAWISSKGQHGQNPERVSNLIVRLVEKKSSKMQHIIGFDAQIILMIRKLLPHRLYTLFLDCVFKLMVFGFEGNSKEPRKELK